MALLMQNVSTPEQVFLRTFHAYFPTYTVPILVLWLLSCNDFQRIIFQMCVYISSFFCMFQENGDFSFIDNCIAMRFSYGGNYDKAVESRLIVSFEEISLI